MALDDEVLQPYIERLLALQSERAESLTAAELREVAYDLGLTDADLEAAEESAEKGLQRGLGYLQHGRHDDAVRELSAAAALAPERTDILQARPAPIGIATEPVATPRIGPRLNGSPGAAWNSIRLTSPASCCSTNSTAQQRRP